jgi:uncharacterized protein (TIGR02145 family)
MNAEWQTLVSFVGSPAGTKLKASSPDWDGTDEFGFSALPGGYRYYTYGSFRGLGLWGNWWTATENDVDVADYRIMDTDVTDVYNSITYKDHYGLSVRCLQD